EPGDAALAPGSPPQKPGSHPPAEIPPGPGERGPEIPGPAAPRPPALPAGKGGLPPQGCTSRRDEVAVPGECDCACGSGCHWSYPGGSLAARPQDTRGCRLAGRRAAAGPRGSRAPARGGRECRTVP